MSKTRAAWLLTKGSKTGYPRAGIGHSAGVGRHFLPLLLGEEDQRGFGGSLRFASSTQPINWRATSWEGFRATTASSEVAAAS